MPCASISRVKNALPTCISKSHVCFSPLACINKILISGQNVLWFLSFGIIEVMRK